MLILNRKVDEAIVIGDGVVIRVLAVVDGRVKLGISAPRSIAVWREELRGEGWGRLPQAQGQLAGPGTPNVQQVSQTR